MGYFKVPWGLTGALLAATYMQSICASGVPSINVALKTSFSSAPYLLELLETAGDENATSYFPLLDRIADGYFYSAETNKDLYEMFMKVLRDDQHMDSQTLSSYGLALSLHSAAPRIEAHYQYYHTSVEPALEATKDTTCPVWVLFNGKQYCTPNLDTVHGNLKPSVNPQTLQFDRINGNLSAPPSILYADITSPTFAQFHKTLAKTARDGKTSYRVRHRKPVALSSSHNPLVISGYGVELALKRTDYIVIDDRDSGEPEPVQKKSQDIDFEDEELADLRPLSSSELVSLGLKASSFVMQSEDPLQTLLKLSQDFPKYSSAMTAHNTSKEFVKEHKKNRGLMIPAGTNILWINGVQIEERQVDAFTLLDLLRQERRFISGIEELGLTAGEAISLLSHANLGTAKAGDEPQRFDWRDTNEGGKVIIWLNDIEKDKRYESWPVNLNALLQRTFPGQLPSVRRDMFNLVLPVDLSNPDDVNLVVEQIQSFVKRKLPLRFGIVPLTQTIGATGQAKVVYHLLESYGISAVLAYLESTFSAKHTSMPSKSDLEVAVSGRKLRVEKESISLDMILKADHYTQLVESSKSWASRLAADGAIPPLFVNGAVLTRDANWLQAMSMRVNADLLTIQRAVYEEALNDDFTWIPMVFLSEATSRRNPYIVPEDEKTLRFYDIRKLHLEHAEAFKQLPYLPADPSASSSDWAQMIIVADLETKQGQQLCSTAFELKKINTGIELVILPTSTSWKGVTGIYSYLQNEAFIPLNEDSLKKLIEVGSKTHSAADTNADSAQSYWAATAAIAKTIDLAPGQQGILINGRLIGPFSSSAEFTLDDFVQALAYERTKRISPVYSAMADLQILNKIIDPLTVAKLTSVVAISSRSNIPEGISEQTPAVRVSVFDAWDSLYTSITAGNNATARIRIVGTLDPASEQAQRWTPILKVLSELEGVHLKLFLNPMDHLKELPVKRFYRYVLDSKPTFSEDGSLKNLGASFTGVPQEALLTVGMDVPSSWLVAPKISVHDLDNVKLSNSKGNVDATYELEHILIEGHSREVSNGEAPRGAQLVLATQRDPHFADTIIMANLGYFQFKANPGFYKINLQKGRSSDIFNIDSLGASGFTAVAGDNTTDIALMSFQGTTLYPRLSRKPGQAEEDVLENKANTTKDFVAQGIKFAESILGLGKGKADVVSKPADINIFSVASGHLYERMLNIMMVSVMKHTKHTVKFWFIEQFLSPSFKDFIPHLAVEYGFEYEMVTYKWPHWLREQTEKQREIWGYKILFLDVLFPLSLDKVIFVDADQIVRTDMIELVNHDLKGAPYGFTPMCDSRIEMEGFRFWKQGYWKNFLKGLPYHISALYVVDLHRFRQIAAGDRLRQQYHQLSADPGSLSNLDQDLPNHMQMVLPIHSLPQEWLWCETWCSDESLKEAKTIDLCNNPQTKEPKLDRARRQVPEWTVYDDEIAAVDKKRRGLASGLAGDDVTTKNSKSRTLEAISTSHTIDEL